MRAPILRTMTTLASSQRRPIHLMLDFDGTITVKDTMFAYGTIADNRDIRLDRPPLGSDTFKKFGTAWMDDYTAHEQNYIPKPQDRKDIRQEIEWLTSLAKVETASAERVEMSEFFRHVIKDDIRKTSESLLQSGQVAFRAGWERLFSSSELRVGGVDHPGMYISINSVNWSERLIRTMLSSAVYRSNLNDKARQMINEMVIKANELDGLDNQDGASGRLNDDTAPSTRTADEKHRNLTALYDNNAHNVYVGDSPTDLRCLLAADLGICVRNDPMSSSSKELADVFARTGYEVSHVRECNYWPKKGLEGEKSGILWANSFDEIADLFERLQNVD